jgi:hypothetical protein
VRSLVWVLALTLLAAQGRAQEPPSEEPPRPPPAIAAADIPSRAAAEASSLRAAASLLERSASLDEIGTRLAARRGAIARGHRSVPQRARDDRRLGARPDEATDVSNIYNVLGILGPTARVRPIVVPQEIALLDIWVMLAATAVLLAAALTGWRVTRFEGSLMLGAHGRCVACLAIAAA